MRILQHEKKSPAPLMGRTFVARFPFNNISIDPYVSNRGHTCVLLVISHFSGFTFSKALKNPGTYATSKALAKLFMDFGT